MLKPGQTLAVTIDKPAAGGRMIARVDGQVLLVSGAIPGEQVVTRIERVSKGVAYADVCSVERASPDRRETSADPACGGCLYAHMTYERQLAVKALVIQDGFARIGRLALPSDVVVAGSPEEGYRMRARLHIRGGQVGFFREGSHDLCDPRGTRQLRSDACDALEQLGAVLRSLGAFDPTELEFSESLDGTQRALHVDRLSRVVAGSLVRIGTPSGVTGLSASIASEQGGGYQVITGDPHVTDELLVHGCELALRRHVLAFFQANRFLLPALAAYVTDRIAPEDRVVDLYAGTGLFAVAAAVIRGARVTAVEGDRTAAADLAANAAGTHGLVAAVQAPVEQFVMRTQDAPEVLIVDPPRTGMSNEAIGGAINMGARTVVYVSCDVATLARDARKLVAAGYTLQEIDGFDLFPNTPHVETVATFRRS